MRIQRFLAAMPAFPLPIDDPSALAGLGGLEMIARLIVEGYMIGQHKSPFKGSSVEFVEHRQYYPGDDVRHVDWRALGKTGKYYIKEFEEETNLRCYLLMDVSGSMAYGESTISKFEYGRILAAALAYLLTVQRDAIGLVTFDERIRDRIDPSTRSKNYQLIASCLQDCQPGRETGMAALFEQLLPTFKRRCLAIVVSDFFDDPAALQHVLQQFRKKRHEVILLQVLAPEELEFPFEKPTQFRSLERDSHRILVDPHRLRKVYLKQFQAFQDELKAMSLGCGFDLLTVSTAEPFGRALGAYLDWRARRRKAPAG
jgi:uncharacterized protein (DUF58 family)